MNKTQKYYQENMEQKKLYQYNYYHNSEVTYEEYLENKRKNAREYQRKYRLKKKQGDITQCLIKKTGKFLLDFT